jgi:type IV secretory pathway VirB2 component (pilin)
VGHAARTQTRAQARAQAGSARQKLVARRAAQRRAAVRRRLLLTVGAVSLVLALAVALIVVKVTAPGAPGGAPAAQTSQRIATEVTGVPAATFDTVGAGTATGLKAISGTPELTSGGKPEVLYIGGEYCPFCAAERWALAAALSRFGTLSGLSFIHSSPTDGYVPTLSFYKSGYSSNYLAFAPVEWFGEASDPSTPFQHVYLQQPTTQEAALFARYANGSLPFVDIGNRYLVPQAQYLPTDIEGLSWAQIAAAMRDPSSRVARDIDGAANALTAAMCVLTHGQPSGVCTSAGVKAAAGSL